MSRSLIKNISFEALPLPAAFGGHILPPTSAVIVDQTAALVIAQLGGDAAIANIWQVEDTNSAAAIDIVDSAANQSLTVAGAIDLTHDVTRIVVSAAGVVFTLAAGYLGQIKTIYLDTVTHVGVDTAVITPVSGGPWAMGTAGDSMVLKYNGTSWLSIQDNRYGVRASGTIAGTLTVTDLLATAAALTVNATPVAGTALGTVRSIIGSMTVANAGVASGMVAGVRGLVTLTGSIASGPTFMAGAQGKAILDGAVLAAGSGHISAVYAQMSASGTTVTDGHVAPLIVSGQNLPTSANVNMIYCESGGGKVNAVLQSNVKSTYIFDLNNFESGGNIAAAGTAGGSAGNATHCAANRVLVCLIDGSAGYIPVFNSNA